MLDLAMNNTGDPIRLKDVAKRQEISDKYLEQIIAVLNKAGGSLSPVECTDDPGLCPRETGCATAILWKKLSDAVNAVVDNVTLEDLLTWQQSLADDYVI